MIVGIDPGYSVAVAVYDPENNRVVEAEPIPTFEIKKGKSVKTELNEHKLVALFRDLKARDPNIVGVIEDVHAMTGQGVTSMFNFGGVFRAIRIAMVAAGIPYHLVQPAVWKKSLACPADKDGALMRASQLMPDAVDEWTPKRGHRTKEVCKGVAEAAMIALYGARKILT